MDEKIIVFSLSGSDENVGMVVEETENAYVLKNAVSVHKELTQDRTIKVEFMPFLFSVSQPKAITINKRMIVWMGSEIDNAFKKQYTAHLSGLVVSSSSDLKQLEKIVKFPQK